MKMPDKPIDTNVIQSLMARVKTEEVRKGIQLADQLSDMILLYSVFIRENSWFLVAYIA